MQVYSRNQDNTKTKNKEGDKIPFAVDPPTKKSLIALFILVSTFHLLALSQSNYS